MLLISIKKLYAFKILFPNYIKILSLTLVKC